jgi:hypothetical protein
VKLGAPQQPGPPVSQICPLAMHMVQVGFEPPMPSQEIGTDAVVHGQSLSLAHGRWHLHEALVDPRMG